MNKKVKSNNIKYKALQIEHLQLEMFNKKIISYFIMILNLNFNKAY